MQHPQFLLHKRHLSELLLKSLKLRLHVRIPVVVAHVLCNRVQIRCNQNQEPRLLPKLSMQLA